MGYPVEIFVNSVDDNLCCSICRDVLKRPHCCPDGHCFCFDCISHHINLCGGLGPCPNDRRPVTLQSLCAVLNLSGLIDNLQIRCSTTERNEDAERPHCAWTGPLCRLDVHLRDQCQFHLVLCPLEGCSTKIMRQELAAHQAQCSHRLVFCQHCQVRLQFANKDVHLRQECPSVIVYCPYICGELLQRRSINYHISAVCHRRMVQCEVQGCGHWCRAADLERHMSQKGSEHTLLLRSLMLTNTKYIMRDTFVYTLRWAIPEFPAKMTELGEYKGIASRRLEIRGKMFVFRLYPKGFTMHPDAVGVFIDILPHTGPVLVKSFRVSLTNGTSTYTKSSAQSFILNPPHLIHTGFRNFIDPQSLMTWVDSNVLDICIHLQLNLF